MSKTYTHAGVSSLNGAFKVRFANDGLRTKVLIKNGHKDIDIVELKNPMTKVDAVAYLQSIDFATRDGKTNPAVLAALNAEAEKRAATKAPKTKTAKAPKKPKVSMEAIKAKVEAKKTAPKSTVTRSEVEAQLKDMEDAPF